MKILWFTSSPSNASAEFGNNNQGCGWISALETIISEANEHELGICFTYPGYEYKKITKGNVQYFGIPILKKNGLKRILNRHLAKVDDHVESPLYDEIIKDFAPDLIHVFGTENAFGKILINKFDKVVFHLQGLTAPCYEAYFPPGFTRMGALLNDSFGNIIRGLTFFHLYNIFGKRLKREAEILKHWKYFSGRTDFDRNYINLMNPGATYFHCEELLRNEFFATEWKMPTVVSARKKIVIGTTINPNIFKGLDLVYKVLPLLEDYDITWNIFGVTEDGILNKVVKKVLRIKGQNTAIIFHGQLPASNLVTELKKCHFFVHPSYIDNSPNSVCEAMLLGMPVVASSVGGIKSLIENRITGFLFNPYDKYDLAGLITHLVNNYELATAAGKAAKQAALKRHNPVEIIQVINDMYYQVSQEGKPKIARMILQSES